MFSKSRGKVVCVCCRLSHVHVTVSDCEIWARCSHTLTHTHTHTHTPPGPTLLMRYPMSHLSQMALNTTCEKDGAYAVTHMTSEETATSRPHHTQGRCHLHRMPIVTKPAATAHPVPAFGEVPTLRDCMVSWDRCTGVCVCVCVFVQCISGDLVLLGE